MMVDCTACKSEKTMEAVKIKRFEGVVRFIGWVIVIPSAIGAFFSFIGALFTFLAAGTAGTAVVSEAEAVSVALAASTGIGFFVFIGICSITGGLLGWLLIMKKKVYKCTICGFVINRA